MILTALTEAEVISAIRNAYECLDPEDKENIRQQANRLRDSIRNKNPKVRFGFDAALLVLASIGMGINDNRVRFSK